MTGPLNHVMRHLGGFDIQRLFLCLGLLSLTVASAQQPAALNVSLVGHHKPPQASTGFGDVWGEGDLACLGVWTAYSSYGVGIYDIANPAAPQLRSVYNFGTGVGNRFEHGVIRDRILYIGSWGGGSLGSGGSGLHIVSLTNPAAPGLLSRITASTPGTVVNGFNNVHTLFLERNYLYEAAHNVDVLSVKVFDLSNPALPVYVRDIYTTNTTKVHQMTVRTNQGGRVILYTSGWGGNDNGAPQSPGQTDLWDVTDIATQPAPWLGRIYSGYNSHSSWPTPDGNTLIVCREMPGGDVKLYDISNPAALASNATPLVTITPASMGLEPDIPHNPVVMGNYLFLSWYQNGLQIFDITDRARPVRVGWYDTYPGAATSSYQGNWGVDPSLGFDKVLVSDIQTGFYVLDASAVLTPMNNYPPMIITSPASLTTTQGAEVTLSAVVTGSALKYQWRLDGTNLPGATRESLNMINLQPAQAGNYTLVVSNATAAVTSAVAAVSISLTPTPFFDDFDSVASSNLWDVFSGQAGGPPDYTVDWAFDYSSYFSAFNNATIPPAPRTTNGTTRGLKLTVNNNDTTATTVGVSLYPKNKFFSGAHKLTFDLWLNYPGGVNGGGSVGSTEHFTAGLNHAGTRVNWHSANPSDGVWFAMDGEGGTTVDYRAYVGNLNSTPTSLSVAAGGFATASRDHTDAYWQSIFPAPTYETPGAPGKKWAQVEVSQDTNNVITWRMNGNLIAQRTNTSAFTSGNVMIGYMDVFNSIASPAADAFAVFDNVSVEIPPDAAPPVIATHPQSQSVYPGQEAVFTVAATGRGHLDYQWRFNGADIPGATSNSFTRRAVQPEAVGLYSVRVANNFGGTVSSNALLLLRDSPYVNAVAATPGSHSALISWTTTLPGDSQVEFEAASFTLPGASAAARGGFSSRSHTDPELTRQHVILLTGLEPGTRYNYQTLSTEGTNTFVSGVYQFTTAGAIIQDNADATFTGSWNEGTSSGDEFGTNYGFTSTVTGSATATATWRPQITTPGKYDVSVWFPQGADRAVNAPYYIAGNSNATTVLVNQQAGGGHWQLIASGVEFAKGTNGFVRLSNDAGPGVVLADAVRLDYVSAQDFPTGPAVPIWWREFFFGSAVDPAFDADADSYTTAQEYVMGTNPTNTTSHLELSGDSGSNGVASVTFHPFLAHRTYDLIMRTNLNAPVWEKASLNPPAAALAGRGVFALATTGDAQNFYRLRVQMTTNTASPAFRALPTGIGALGAEAGCGPFRVYVR